MNYGTNLVAYSLKDLTFYILVSLSTLTEVATKYSWNSHLSNSILHYEPLNYDKDQLIQGHNRVRRSLQPDELLHLNFKAHYRDFNLRLRRDTSLFAEGANYHDNSQTFHPSNIYDGYLDGYPKSRVHGFIHDGIFEGRIHDGISDEFHIESTKQYNHLDPTEHHSVIYSVKDIVMLHPFKCGGVKAATDNHWLIEKQNHTVWDEYGYVRFTNADEVPSYAKHRQRRAAFDPLKIECHLLLRADWTYVNRAGSDTRAMYIMSQHLKSVSHIYETTDFDSDGNSEGYSLKIKKIEAMSKDDCSSSSTSTECLFKDENIGVEKFLDISSFDDHNEYCLSYVFAHRDFSDGVLGLAWIGDKAGAGGICDRFQRIQSKWKSLNTGIVTTINYGSEVTSKVTDITFAHEVGHNFGSQHDPDKLDSTCSPGGTVGNYIMYPRATSGSQSNNFKFSKCSKDSIWSLLQVKSSICFKPSGAPICGNRVVEKGEECDCGYEGDESCLKDQCCTPAKKGEGGCKYSPHAKRNVLGIHCSPSNGFCCDVNTCRPYKNAVQHLCANYTECSETAFCRESQYTCPTPDSKANNTLCNSGKNVCKNGQCTGSLCLLYDETPVECQCTDEKEYCHVCCQSNIQNSTCKSLVQDNKPAMQPPGSPCNQYTGYCDILNKCRRVDAEGPLSRLKKWLFSSETIETILDWMKTYWWACVLIGLGLVLFMAAFIACCSVHTPSSNPNKPPPRPMTLPRSISRRNRPSAPASSNQPRHRVAPGGYADTSLPGYNTATREPQPPRYMDSVEMR